MSKKEKISFLNSNEFESIEDELTAALSRLEEANERISGLLHGETADPDAGEAADAPEEPADTEAPESAPASAQPRDEEEKVEEDEAAEEDEAE